MIDIGIKVFENGPAGLALRVIARGEAKSKREQIYLDKLQPAIQGAIVDAGVEVEKQGLGEALSEEFKAAAQGKAPTPIGPGAVEIPFPLQEKRPRPPLFIEFVEELAKDYRDTAVSHQKQGPAGEERAQLLGAMIDVLVEKAKEYSDRHSEFIAALKAQQPTAGNPEDN